ncbi:MAG TPA: hypothetical protein VF657_25785 [Actinoplanes sp.]
MHAHEVVISHQHGMVELQPDRNGTADAAFIAHARQDVPTLLAEVERLRAVAWQLRQAMTGQHGFVGHVLAGGCAPCAKAIEEGDPVYACDDYKRWQRTYRDALGCVIGVTREQAMRDTRPNAGGEPMPCGAPTECSVSCQAAGCLSDQEFGATAPNAGDRDA